MAETLTVNGVSLESVFCNVLDYGALTSAAPVRGDDLIIPGRDGRLAAVRRWHEQASFVLPLVVKGVDPNTGTIPGGSTGLTELRKRGDLICQVFSADSQPFTIDHTFDDGQTRRAYARLNAAPMDFTREGPGNPLFGQVRVPLTIPDAFWTAITTTTQTLSGVNGATLSFSSFAALTARLVDSTVTIGPGQDVKITAGGVRFGYTGTIASGRKLVVNCGTWDVTGTIDAGGTWAPFTSGISHSGDPRFFVLPPGNPAGTAPQVLIQHSSASVPVSVTIAGAIRYRVG